MRILSTLLALVFALGLSGSVASAQPAGDSYEQLLDQARQAAGESRYRDAIRSLEAAYALRQEPQLLLELARGHRRLGDAKQMVDYYSRYRLAAPSLTPELASEIDSVLRSQAPPPAPSVALQPQFSIKTVTRPHRGMLIGGAMLFSLGYSAAALSGGAFATISSNSGGSSYGNMQAAGGVLFIPFLGPFISAAVYRDAAWVGPWVAIDGSIQLLGLALMIAARYSPETVRILDKAQVLPYASSTGAGLNAAFRF